MSLRIEVVDRNADGGEQRHTVLAFVERELTMETLGMSLDEESMKFRGKFRRGGIK